MYIYQLHKLLEMFVSLKSDVFVLYLYFVWFDAVIKIVWCVLRIKEDNGTMPRAHSLSIFDFSDNQKNYSY
jgi:hypothetical protein